MMRFFWMTFLPLSAAGGAAALLLWLARPALRRFAHIQWSVPVLTAALCLFVLPLPVFAMPGAWNAPAQAVQSSVGTVLPAEAAASEPLFVMTELPTAADKLLRAAPQEHISMLWGLVPAFWLAGVLCVTLALWAEYRRFTRHLAREARPVEDAAVRRCMAHAAKAGGFSRRVGLYVCGALATPVAVGVLRPRIYLPADWAADETLEYALRHECMHLRRGHLVYKLAAQAVCVVHWFNPAAWLLRRMMSEACEFGCDRAVARMLDGAQRKEYCAAMLCAAADVRAAGLASAFASPAGLLRSRMEAVLAPQERTARQFTAVALCTAAAVLAAGLTACAADEAAERVSGSLPKPQTAEPAGTGEEALKIRNALPENSAPGLSESVLTLETSRPPVWPVPEYEYIGTQFGAGHRGTDIAAREGAEILAVWDGTVLEAEYHENWGDYVLLDHGGGIITRYAHCSELLVQPGDTVKAGEAVARVGNTGVASGNHCHLELERNGVLLDPMQKLSAPRDETPRTQARQPEPQNTETWLPPDNELIKERLAGTTGVWPVPEYTFVSRSVGRYHRGVDIAAKKGADIVAPFSGTVTRAEDGEETQYWVYGKYVEIALDGDPGVRVRLTHCSELLVQPGDTVRAGQLVARVGSTGNSTGNHCHLELLADEYYTDPELILTRPAP